MGYFHFKIQNCLRQTISLTLLAFALILITACAQATESERATVSAAAVQLTASEEAIPRPASTSATSAPRNPNEPTLVPVATLASIEAMPATDEAISTPKARETASPGNPARGALPTSISIPVNPTEVPVLVASTIPAPTPAATATPISTTAPAPAPTPRPTPGPITRQTQFVPLDEPKYVSRENASGNITNASYVLGVANNGEARAYPLDMMWYHHIANDTVGGEPWLVTY
ncbi:MAG: DUF3179 domain-containing protein [Chloroflexi bacterium]|jgi:hypothetical protein|nr:DUF3179 domain-containing protein [Chloroflexota bacterium]